MSQPPKLTPLETTFLADVSKALSHPARVRIIKHLLMEEGCVCGRIVEIMPLAQSTVSQHLKVLKEAGLVDGEVSGPKTCYCVNRPRLAKYHALITDLMATTPEAVS